MKAAEIGLFSVLVVGCGMKVNINGKTHTLGGGDETAKAQPGAQQPPQQPQQRSSSAPSQTQTAARDALPAASHKTATIAVKAALTATPMIADVDGVTLDAGFRKTIGGESPDCGSQISATPVAVIDLQAPNPNMHISVHGVRDDGFIVKQGDRFWSTCTQTISTVPEMGPPKDGWQPGHYEVYPVTRYSKQGEAHRLEVAVFDPDHPAAWSDKVKNLTIDKKLAQPLIVEVPVRTDRQRRREGLAGYRCDRAAFAFEPDIALTIARPIPGLVIRPLPTKAPVTLRREHRDDKRAEKMCVVEARDHAKGATWQPDSELAFGNQDEGVYGISVGLPAGATEDKVTLMIFDASTQLDPMARSSLAGPFDIAHRALEWHFPQLDVGTLDLQSYAHAELVAKVFAAAPPALRVYAKIDLDGDIAHAYGPVPPNTFPKKNEPLLVLHANDQRATVLAQDGLVFDIKLTQLTEAPDGAPAPLASPRPLKKDLELGHVEQLLPPADKKLIAAVDAMAKRHDDCIDRVAAPYERQLPTIVHPSNVDVVYVESPRTRQIREAMDNAIDAKCGSRAQYEKQLDAQRVKLLAAVEKARSALFTTTVAAK